MYGWTGRILIVDLTNRREHILEPEKEYYEKFIGGKGLSGLFLREYITREWDDPEMPLIFMTGPLVNTASPTSGMLSIMSKSPLTGTVGDGIVGGKLGTMIKRAGYDGIIFTGKSHAKIGISINEEGVKYSDASGFADCSASEIHESIGDGCSTACTGQAAENGVLFSSIVVDGCCVAGRNGLGLVMASKNLKFMKVSGDKETKVYDSKLLEKAQEEIFRLTNASPALMGEFGISNFGTGTFYDLISSRRMMPTDNFRKTYFEHSDSMNAYIYKTKYKTENSGCAGCGINCWQTGENGESIPEYDSMAHFSALVMNSDLETVMKADKICTETGMDPVSAAATISAYMEISGDKISSDKLLSILKDIAFSKDEGEKLKKGSYRYAKDVGKEHASMTVKNMEIPAYDPRGAYGMALGYAVSARGACHLRAFPISHEILRKPVATDRFSFSGKARIIKISEDINAVVDSLTACKFIFFNATLEEYAKAFTAVTGVEISAQDLMKAGERIDYNERYMNSLNGFDANDDDLPDRFFNEEGSSTETIKVKPLNRKEFLDERAAYYRVRELDEEGRPVDNKLKSLGLI